MATPNSPGSNSAAPNDSAQARRSELTLVEQELADLRRSTADLRIQIGSRAAGATDPAETASVLTAVEEQEAFISALESRREALRGALGLT